MANFNTQFYPGLPVDAFTATDTTGLRRLQVDVAQTGFWAGREFRAFREFTIPAGMSFWVRTTVPPTLRGIVLQDMRMSVYQGGVRVQSWRNGTPGGVWTASDVLPNNAIPDVPGYVRQVVLEHGGTVTGQTLRGDVGIAYANETGKSATTATALVHGERGLAPGTYFVEIQALSGVTVDSLGTLTTIWEERPLDGT